MADGFDRSNYSLNDVLNAEEKHGYFSYQDIDAFIATRGIKKISTKELDVIIDKYKSEALTIDGFQELYGIVSNNESSKIMKWWTIAIGIMTLVMMICTIVMLKKSLS